MTNLVLSDRPISGLKLDAIVIGTSSTDDTLTILPGAEALDEELGGTLADALSVLGAKGGEGEVIKLATLGQASVPLIVAVGLGAPVADSAYDTEQVRRAAGCAARALTGRAAAAITLPGVNGATDPELLGATAEGLMLGGYTFTEYKSEKVAAADAPVKKVSLLVDKARERTASAALKKAVSISEAVAMARDFIATPPSDLYPATFAAKAKAFGTAAGIKVEVLDEKRLATGGFGGILAVGGGSDRKPRLVRMTYTPTKTVKKSTPKLALVGKGITFDSGGISLKPGPKMDEMKTDMSGAAAIVASIVLIAALQLPISVVATIPMAENLPSGSAYRPADVVTFRNGKTAEILNTDAEGRVVLADAIARACEDKPDYLIETSTLTGAQVVALGKRTAGVMGSDEFRDVVTAAGNAVGEAAWAMPLPKEVRTGMDSLTADFANIGDGPGGMLAGGHFLKEFVTDGVQWAHIDIAGPSNNTGGSYGYTPKGPAGVPVRTILRVAEGLIG
ncbi:leucyl aminopeptidase [Antricoccus suffuscus]|uniref:Probable cytosol aminopeptidase n=1 Tax=Antricoccus suffuscus TaxID=1629062 RepID=A0A2T0ZZ24_9ACTN|nr:leucyl aminopeptidase [Antricoccus suffuscus]PRZ41338.1 leucyl aminopeptidase [Antricoccus suffuscus]